jgi:hypothetical protein
MSNKVRVLKPILIWIDGTEVRSREKAREMLEISMGYVSSLLLKNKDNDIFLCKGHRITRRPPKVPLPAGPVESTAPTTPPDPIAEAIDGVKEELRMGREGLVRMVHAYDEAMSRLRKVEDLAIAKGRKAVPASYQGKDFGAAERLG